jgi:hypothetical protein
LTSTSDVLRSTSAATLITVTAEIRGNDASFGGELYAIDAQTKGIRQAGNIQLDIPAARSSVPSFCKASKASQASNGSNADRSVESALVIYYLESLENALERDIAVSHAHKN